jgi:hypothetical protein
MTNTSDPRERMPEVRTTAVLNSTLASALLLFGGFVEDVEALKLQRTMSVGKTSPARQVRRRTASLTFSRTNALIVRLRTRVAPHCRYAGDR